MSFNQKIMSNLQSNGFPAKRVSLPLETLYEKADEVGENLNSILDELKSEGIDHQKTGDKIIFHSTLYDMGLGPDALKQAQDMMNQMDPEQLKQMQEKVMNMTPEERLSMMEQARKMGLL